MTIPDDLANFLASRTPDELAGILSRRPDVRRGTPIGDLRDLADRLTDAESLHLALLGVPEPCIQLIHGLLALGPSTTRSALLELIGAHDLADADVRAVDDALQRLAELAIAWPDGDERLHHDPTLESMISRPMGIGLPTRVFLQRLARQQVLTIAKAWQLPTKGSNAQLLDRLLATITDPKRVRAAIAGAIPNATDYLERMTQVQVGQVRAPRRQVPNSAEEWAARHGLVFGGPYYSPELPVEVVLAIRDGRSRLMFTPRPPEQPARPSRGRHCVPAPRPPRPTPRRPSPR